jgi:hypothetical protein
MPTGCVTQTAPNPGSFEHSTSSTEGWTPVDRHRSSSLIKKSHDVYVIDLIARDYLVHFIICRTLINYLSDKKLVYLRGGYRCTNMKQLENSKETH